MQRGVPPELDQEERQEQRGGIHGGGVFALEERAAFFLPEVRVDVLVDLVPRLAPAVVGVRERAPVGEADPAVDGHPAHQPRVQELLPSAAHLPHPFVGKLPVLGDPVDETNEVEPQVV